MAPDISDQDTEAEAPATQKQAGWAKALDATWDEIEQGGADQVAGDEFSELYKPYASQLETAGLSAPEYARKEHAVAQAFAHNRDELYWAVNDWEASDRTAPHPYDRIHQMWEWNQFRSKYSDAEALREKMGDHLVRHPESKGETIWAALTRAYKAVSQPKAQPKGKKQARHVRDDLEEVWDKLNAEPRR
jgi:uncharacterized protein with von Willebrand factor type A (vWA) domain